jgi:hypothetical protein
MTSSPGPTENCVEAIGGESRVGLHEEDVPGDEDRVGDDGAYNNSLLLLLKGEPPTVML